MGMKDYTHLSQDEREFIFLQPHQGACSSQIARELGRSHSIVRREIQRNSSSAEDNSQSGYSPAVAAQHAKQQNQNGKRAQLTDPSLQRWMIRHLTRSSSPEQSAGRLKRDAPHAAVSDETIDRFVNSPEQRSLRLWEFLQRGHPHRRVHHGRDLHTARLLSIPHRISIAQRPREANLRQLVGHYESDL